MSGKVLTDPANDNPNPGTTTNASVLAISPTSVSGTTGQQVTLSASVLDKSGQAMSGQSITWTSTNTQVASVSSTGLVTLLGAGSANIAASSDGLTTAVPTTVAIAGPAPVATISVSPSSVSLNPGGTSNLSATPTDSTGHQVAGATVAWSSSNSSVATVSTSGVVTAIAVGSAIITASSQGKSGTSNVSVVAASPAAVASVTLSPSPTSVYISRTVQVTATLKDANGNVLGGRTISWSSSNTSDATVSTAGLVSGVATGSVTITATSGGVNGTVSVSVSAVPVASVTVTPSSSSLEKGQTLQLGATDKDANGTVISGNSVTWSSSNTGVASVSSSGLVTSVAVGSATITASSSGKSGTATITVTPMPVANVSVSPSGATIVKGTTSQLSASATDQTGTAISGTSFSWSSSNTGVATVSSSGLVTGVAAGGATITASAGGKSGTATITVTNPAVASVTVSPATASLTVGNTQQLTATDKDGSGNTISGQSVTWSSSNTGVATVSSSGLVSALTAGSATITASSGGKSGTAAMTVTSGSGTGTGSSCVNNPAGYTTAFDEQFNVVPPNHPSKDADGWFTYTPGNVSIQSDATAPKSAPNIGRLMFPQGSPGGDAPVSLGNTSIPTNSGNIYMCVFVRISANWNNNGNVGTKFVFFRSQYYGAPNGTNHYWGFDDGGSNTSMNVMGGLQWGDSQARDLYANTSNSPNVAGGAWHQIEVLWQAESPAGSGNGVVKNWIDGKQTASYTNVSFFRAGQTPSWDEVDILPTFGGGLNPVPANQWFDVDDMLVTVK